MTKQAKRLGLTLALAALTLLALLPVVTLAAEEEVSGDPQLTLTGQLSFDEEMQAYVLIEDESGDAITLTGTVDFAEYEGSAVHLTGKWVEDSDGMNSFQVTRIDRAS